MVDYWWCGGNVDCVARAQSGSGWWGVLLVGGLVVGFFVVCGLCKWSMSRERRPR